MNNKNNNNTCNNNNNNNTDNFTTVSSRKKVLKNLKTGNVVCRSSSSVSESTNDTVTYSAFDYSKCRISLGYNCSYFPTDFRNKDGKVFVLPFFKLALVQQPDKRYELKIENYKNIDKIDFDLSGYASEMNIMTDKYSTLVYDYLDINFFSCNYLEFRWDRIVDSKIDLVIFEEDNVKMIKTIGFLPNIDIYPALDIPSNGMNGFMSYLRMMAGQFMCYSVSGYDYHPLFKSRRDGTSFEFRIPRPNGDLCKIKGFGRDYLCCPMRITCDLNTCEDIYYWSPFRYNRYSPSTFGTSWLRKMILGSDTIKGSSYRDVVLYDFCNLFIFILKVIRGEDLYDSCIYAAMFRNSILDPVVYSGEYSELSDPTKSKSFKNNPFVWIIIRFVSVLSLHPFLLGCFKKSEMFYPISIDDGDLIRFSSNFNDNDSSSTNRVIYTDYDVQFLSLTKKCVYLYFSMIRFRVSSSVHHIENKLRVFGMNTSELIDMGFIINATKGIFHKGVKLYDAGAIVDNCPLFYLIGNHVLTFNKVVGSANDWTLFYVDTRRGTFNFLSEFCDNRSDLILRHTMFYLNIIGNKQFADNDLLSQAMDLSNKVKSKEKWTTLVNGDYDEDEDVIRYTKLKSLWKSYDQIST